MYDLQSPKTDRSRQDWFKPKPDIDVESMNLVSHIHFLPSKKKTMKTGLYTQKQTCRHTCCGPIHRRKKLKCKTFIGALEIVCARSNTGAWSKYKLPPHQYTLPKYNSLPSVLSYEWKISFLILDQGLGQPLWKCKSTPPKVVTAHEVWHVPHPSQMTIIQPLPLTTAARKLELASQSNEEPASSLWGIKAGGYAKCLSN